jgi:hypothetical protein
MTLTKERLDELEKRFRARLSEGEDWDDVGTDDLLPLIAAARELDRYKRAMEKAQGYLTKIEMHTVCSHAWHEHKSDGAACGSELARQAMSEISTILEGRE